MNQFTYCFFGGLLAVLPMAGILLGLLYLVVEMRHEMQDIEARINSKLDILSLRSGNGDKVRLPKRVNPPNEYVGHNLPTPPPPLTPEEEGM